MNKENVPSVANLDKGQREKSAENILRSLEKGHIPSVVFHLKEIGLLSQLAVDAITIGLYDAIEIIHSRPDPVAISHWPSHIALTYIEVRPLLGNNSELMAIGDALVRLDAAIRPNYAMSAARYRAIGMMDEAREMETKATDPFSPEVVSSSRGAVSMLVKACFNSLICRSLKLALGFLSGDGAISELLTAFVGSSVIKIRISTIIHFSTGECGINDFSFI